MQTLTDKQKHILEVIRTHIEQRGHAPTVREIGKEVGLSSSCTVKKHLEHSFVKLGLHNRRQMLG